MAPTGFWCKAKKKRSFLDVIKAFALDGGESLESGRQIPQYRALLNVLEDSTGL